MTTESPLVESCDDVPVRTVDAVLALLQAAQEHDGVRPLSEAAELRLRAGTARTGVRHLLCLGVAPADGGAPVRGYAQVSGLDGAGPEVELVVHPDHRRAGCGRALLGGSLREAGEATLRGWAHGDCAAARELASSAGFVAVRRLLRMRRDMAAPLPEVPSVGGVVVRAFRPGADDADWLRVNARAFATHPEQGRWTGDDLAARMREPWFSADGFLLAEDAASGELLGYHWTKVEDGVGEVYVVGVDPAAQGRRLGSVLTLAGLHHLRQRGVPVVDLYVEADNGPALAVYRRLGFEEAAVDVMYERRG